MSSPYRGNKYDGLRQGLQKVVCDRLRGVMDLQSELLTLSFSTPTSGVDF